MRTWVGGRPGRAIDPRDRGLHYGDGLFETMRVVRRAVRLLDFHLERLQGGCERLMIDAPGATQLRREVERCAATRQSGVLKLIVTRGVGERGYRPSGRERCTRIMLLGPPPAAGVAAVPAVRLRICTTRLGTNPRLAGLKTLNRLEQVLARSEWSDAKVGEGLMLDHADHVVCGTMSNVFLRRGDLLMTPLLDRCGVAGVMRRWVLGEAGALGLRTIERRVRLADLGMADEIFVTNAVRGVLTAAEIRTDKARLRPAERGTAEALRSRLGAL